MSCCNQCEGIEDEFDEGTASRDLKRYRKKGPSKSTLLLLEAIRSDNLAGLTLLDIGGGVGTIQHELVKSGIDQVYNVDASSAYLKAAREEAAAQGYHHKATYQHGNYVDLADSIPAVDVVTLDKVLCCYDDMHALVTSSAVKAARLYGVVYPRDSWLMRLLLKLIDLIQILRRSQFRTFVHATQQVNGLLEAAGLRQRLHRTAGVWQVVLYERTDPI